jgi:hypothetical protein
LPYIASGTTPVDGVLDAAYGPPRAVQTVQTQFGDNFSELNAGYARIEDGTLYLMLTGNLENNFNKLNIFFDSSAGGQNVIGGSNPNNDNWSAKHSGMTFDTAFTADYLFILRHGDSGGGNRFDLDYAVLGGGANDFDTYGDVFGGFLEGAEVTAAGANLGHSFAIGFDNSNVAGVLGGTAAADQIAAEAVLTGIELGIPLSALGNPSVGDTIRISAMINGSQHDFLSNQLLGGLPAPQGNLGGDGNGGFTGSLSGINLNNFAGDQFFTVVVPEPSTYALVGLGLGALLAFRRRK